MASHRLGGLLGGRLIFQIPYRLLALRRPGRPQHRSDGRRRWAVSLIALLIVNWLADVVTGRLASL